MDCKDFEEHVTVFVEGGLEGSLLQTMEEHRSSCPKCARLAETHRLIFTSLNDTKPVKAPEGLANRILAAVKSEAPDNVVEFTPAETHSAATFAQGKPSLDCKSFEDHIAAYVEGLLEGDLLRRMKEHRASCPSCERLASMHNVVLTSLNTTEPVRAPEGLAERILEAVKVKLTKAEKVFSFKRFETLTAALTATGSLVAASIILVSIIIKRFPTTVGWSFDTNAIFSQLTMRLPDTGNWTFNIDAILLKLNVLSLSLKTWMAGKLSSPLLEKVSLLYEPVQLPFVSLSFPPYYLAALIILAVGLWSYFSAPIAYGIPVASSYDDMVM